MLGTAAIAAATSVPHGTVVHAVGAPIEGTECRFGVPGSAFFGQVTTAGADGARIRHMTASQASAVGC